MCVRRVPILVHQVRKIAEAPAGALFSSPRADKRKTLSHEGSKKKKRRSGRAPVTIEGRKSKLIASISCVYLAE